MLGRRVCDAYRFSYAHGPTEILPAYRFLEAEQGVRVVVAYIEKKPERGRDDFTKVALEAPRSKWPCH